MERFSAVTAGLFLLLTPAAASADPRIFIASDSTASNYPADRHPQAGWGMMLRCGLAPGVEVVNRAIGGRSTRTFISEGRWDSLIQEAVPGDMVLIQFGHNDASGSRPERYAPAESVYRDNLLRMIWEAKGKGLVPVLVTPPVRRSFVDGHIKADFAEYSRVMRELVVTTNTPLIDLEARSAVFFDQLGAEAAKRYFLHYSVADKVPAYPNGIADDTHFNELGARAVANLVAQELKGLRIPVAEKVLTDRPDLMRTAPLGNPACR